MREFSELKKNEESIMSVFSIRTKPAVTALAIFLFCFVGAGLLRAGQTGKIAGVIIDKSTQEPLIGANVFLEGTGLGAATDVDGDDGKGRIEIFQILGNVGFQECPPNWRTAWVRGKGA